MAKQRFKDVTQEQRESALKLGISITTIKNRLSRGWTIEDAISEKTKPKGGRNDASKLVNREETKTDIVKEDELMSNSWFAGTNKGLKCPVDGCNHVGQVITKVHCLLVHGMERHEVAAKYGMPTIMESKGEILSENNGRSKWYSTSIGMGAL